MSNGMLHATDRGYTAWLLAIMILSPSFVLVAGYPSLRLEYLIVVMVILFSFFKVAVSRRAIVSVDGMGLLFVLMSASCLISITWSVLFLGEEILVNDWFIFIQFVLYYAIFRIARVLSTDKDTISRIYRLVFGVGIFVGIFSVLQYFNVFQINRRFLAPLYFHNTDWVATKARLLVQGVHWRRIVGTFGNPNYCGMFFAILWAAVISYYLFPVGKKMRYHVLVGAGMGIVALIMLTGSRTALLSFSVITIFSLLLGKLTTRKLKFISAVVLGGIFAVFLFVPSYSLKRVLIASNYSSVQLHIESYRIALGQIEKSPILGLGPQKEQLRSVVDNEYLLYARRYGLVGLLLLLILHFYPLSKGFIRFTNAKKSIDRNLGLLTIQLSVIWAVYGLTSDVFKNPQMMGIVFFFFGLSWAKRAEQGGRLTN